MKGFRPDRRKFLKLSVGAAGAGLVLGINWSCSSEQSPGSAGRADSFVPNAWLRLAPEGSVTVIVAESEMGQGPYTLMPMMVAEDLDVDWSDIRVERASVDPVYGYQMTGNSSSIRKGWSTLREAGAIARQMLLAAAAERMSVPVAECQTRSGRVMHVPSAREIAYQDLIETAADRPLPDFAELKEPGEFQIIGQPVPRTDGPDKLNGKARFGIDIRLPDMLYATTLHCPVFGGRLKRLDDSSARAIKGVRDVFEIDEAVAVVASDTWTAFKAARVLDIDWDVGDKSGISSESIIAGLRALPREQGEVISMKGDPGTAGGKRISAEYLQPFQSHVPLEPMNCTAHFRDDGRLEIWAPTQSPSAAYDTARDLVQSKLERKLKSVRHKLLGGHDDSIDVHTTLLGGGFGRRLYQDFVAEAVQIAQHFEQPVQLVWSREEDVQHDHYHPLTLHRMSGALDADGMPVAWEHVIAGHEVSASGATPPYAIANSLVQLQNQPTVIPKGAWRSVAPHHNIFAMEHFFDELAHAGGQDPLELRIRLLKEHPRLRNVLEIAADKSGWSGPTRGSASLGAAVISKWGSHVAQVLELEQGGDQRFKIRKVSCVIDCGIVINPDIVKQQMEGSIIFGLSAATKPGISIRDGRVEQSNYHDYPILTIDETPEIEVHLVTNEEEPGGIGEPGVPPLAPALANAMLAATGKAIRELPIRLG